MSCNILDTPEQLCGMFSGVRAEHRLQRQRGAGARELASVQFGFTFGLAAPVIPDSTERKENAPLEHEAEPPAKRQRVDKKPPAKLAGERTASQRKPVTRRKTKKEGDGKHAFVEETSRQRDLEKQPRADVQDAAAPDVKQPTEAIQKPGTACLRVQRTKPADGQEEKAVEDVKPRRRGRPKKTPADVDHNDVADPVPIIEKTRKTKAKGWGPTQEPEVTPAREVDQLSAHEMQIKSRQETSTSIKPESAEPLGGMDGPTAPEVAGISIEIATTARKRRGRPRKIIAKPAETSTTVLKQRTPEQAVTKSKTKGRQRAAAAAVSNVEDVPEQAQVAPSQADAENVADSSPQEEPNTVIEAVDRTAQEAQPKTKRAKRTARARSKQDVDEAPESTQASSPVNETGRKAAQLLSKDRPESPSAATQPEATKLDQSLEGPNQTERAQPLVVEPSVDQKDQSQSRSLPAESEHYLDSAMNNTRTISKKRGRPKKAEASTLEVPQQGQQTMKKSARRKKPTAEPKKNHDAQTDATKEADDEHEEPPKEEPELEMKSTEQPTKPTRRRAPGSRSKRKHVEQAADNSVLPAPIDEDGPMDDSSPQPRADERVPSQKAKSPVAKQPTVKKSAIEPTAPSVDEPAPEPMRVLSRAPSQPVLRKPLLERSNNIPAASSRLFASTKAAPEERRDSNDLMSIMDRVGGVKVPESLAAKNRDRRLKFRF